VAGEGATFNDLPYFAGGIVPGDGIFATWSYRAGAGRKEAFLLNPHPVTAQTTSEWGVVAEVVPDGNWSIIGWRSGAGDRIANSCVEISDRNNVFVIRERCVLCDPMC
jgi:enoyl-CoA hydratase/carnithine racemase